MAQSEIFKPIHVILHRDNYFLWVQSMCSFLKSHKLWLYVTGQCHPPKQQKDETEDSFTLRLEDLDGVNHQIITWLRNTSTPSVSMEFEGYDTAKDIWDMLLLDMLDQMVLENITSWLLYISYARIQVSASLLSTVV
jgi:hypothetical protein